jgi:hypothetical protein
MRPDTNCPETMYTALRNLLAILAWIATPSSADMRMEAETARYSGFISSELNQALFTMAEGKTVRRLDITSTGGEVEAGIALGLWVHERGLDVVVSGHCLSACANYVFPAGRRRIIRPGAVVAWHGNYNHLVQTGLWRDDIAARTETRGEDAATARTRAREEAERLARLERDFFARIGVDEYLCWIGKQPPYSVPNYYFLSAGDMARFGLTDVSTPPGYAGTDVSGFDADIVYIELE